MNLAWLIHPMWLIVNSLVAFRLTRLVAEDMLPPLPALRARLTAWAEARWEHHLWNARQSDRLNPEHQADELAEKARARAGGWTPRALTGPAEKAETERQHTYGNTHPAAYLVGCYWCAGFWLSAAVAFLGASLLPEAVWAFIAAPLALSAIVGLLAGLIRD